MVAVKRKAAEVDVQDIRRVYSLFVDVKRSTTFLREYEQEFMFSEDMKPLKKADEAEGEKMETDWTKKTAQSLSKKMSELKKF